MDVIKLENLANARVLVGSQPTGASSENSAESPVSVRAIHHRRWTIRNQFDRVLIGLPDDVWANPGKQRAWKLIKQNGAREVWRAEIAGAVYYVKYFAQRPIADTIKRLFRTPTCQAEWNSGVFALQQGIAAVRPMAFVEHVARDGRRYSILITEGIEPSQPLSEFWQSLLRDDNPRRRREDQMQIIERLAELIARAHQAGFEHLDMHAANLLVQPAAPRQYRVLLVDLHSARLDVPIHDAAVVRNLAQLNQWFRRFATIADRLRFLRAYLRFRNEFETTCRHGRAINRTFHELVHDLAASADRQARDIWAQRDRRVGRSGRYFSRVRVAGGWAGNVFLRCKHSHRDSPTADRTFDADWWAAQLAHPLRWFAADTSCKNSHSAQVHRAELAHPDGSISMILKRPLARNWVRRLRMWLGRSRSMRGWHMGHALVNRDIRAARPLAMLEKRLGPIVLDSMLITELVPNAIDLAGYIRREYAQRSRREWRACKHALSTALVAQLRRLEERGFAHLDCKAENLLVAGDPPRLVWIDMDGVRFVRHVTDEQKLAALARLFASVAALPGLARGDFARFLRDWCSRFGSRQGAWREIWRSIAPRVLEKQRQQERRRTWKLKHYRRV
ncbi:MAG: hypothetical protein JNG88_16955 [Phycisphaerales bacterium]|nr:hypothetical protein [Phycisphaerales bacterium]